jgi:hypothetical protein
MSEKRADHVHPRIHQNRAVQRLTLDTSLLLEYWKEQPRDAIDLVPEFTEKPRVEGPEVDLAFGVPPTPVPCKAEARRAD